MAPVPPGQCIDSRNQIDALLGKDPMGRPHLMHEAGNLALRMGNWKYIPPGKTRDGLGPWTSVSISKPGALYDLNQAIDERVDVADQHPEIVQRLQQLHQQIRTVADQPDRLGQ